MPSYLKTLADELTDAGLKLPDPVARYVAGAACPFALDTKKRLPDWCAAHGYSGDQRQILAKIVRLLVTRDAYHKAIISGAHRIDLDGTDTGPVSDADRENAVRARTAILAMRQTSQQQPAQPPKPTPEPPAPASAQSTDVLAAAIDTVLAQSESEPPALPAEPIAPAVHVSPVPAPKFVRVALPRRTASATPTSRSAESPTAKILRPSPPAFLPTSVIREAVERIGARRHSVRLIATFSRAQNRAAAAAERASWIADSIRSLVADGHPHDAVTVQVPQVVDYMLTGVVSRQA